MTQREAYLRLISNVADQRRLFSLNRVAKAVFFKKSVFDAAFCVGADAADNARELDFIVDFVQSDC